MPPSHPCSDLLCMESKEKVGKKGPVQSIWGRWQAGRKESGASLSALETVPKIGWLHDLADTAFDARKEKKGGWVTSLISTDSTQLSLAMSVFREDTL
jgi:hypothetical protein